jgi:hypothetical protein
MKIRLSMNDVYEIMGIDVLRDANFQTNAAVRELVIFSSGYAEFKIRSAVTTYNILGKLNNVDTVLSVLMKVANYANKYSSSDKYSAVLIDIVSFSLLDSFLKNFPNRKEFLLQYYDELSSLPCYAKNQFFWLQYAISCIETEEFLRAQTYLDNAYAYAPLEDGRFVPFQINNQQARLYLELIEKGKSKDVISDLIAAHKLLTLPIVSRKDNEENVVRLFFYYCHQSLQKHYNTEKGKDTLRLCCKEAYTRLNKYINEQPFTREKFNKLREMLIKQAL